jgi:hypothetical protein
VTAGATQDTLLCPFNDASAVADLLDQHRGQVAAVLLEPIAGNMGVVPPRPDYLETLRELTEKHGAILVFDEVMTGFRVAYGGAQARYGVSSSGDTIPNSSSSSGDTIPNSEKIGMVSPNCPALGLEQNSVCILVGSLTKYRNEPEDHSMQR